MEELQEGYVIDQRFEIVEQLNQGGMGSIYKAIQLSLNRDVALKIMRMDSAWAESASFRERFLREANLCASLSHPNVVTIYDYGHVQDEIKDICFIAMEILKGETLAERMQANEGLTAYDAVNIILEIARGLRHSHSRGVIHRDIKPDNIMLIPETPTEELVKLIDFGLVRQVKSNSKLTTVGTYIGSPTYMSPEQINELPVDPRTDIYSLGVVLYECLAGHPPFQDEKAMQILMAHLGAQPPKIVLSNNRTNIPEELERIVYWMLEKKPQARPKSMDVLIEHLYSIQRYLKPEDKVRIIREVGTSEAACPALSPDSKPSIWFLTQDPAMREPQIDETMQKLRQQLDVLMIEEHQYPALFDGLEDGSLEAPWVLVFGDLHVLLKDPLLCALQDWLALSKVLISTHYNPEMLQTSINFCGLDYHLCLPEAAENIVALLYQMLARSRSVRLLHEELLEKRTKQNTKAKKTKIDGDTPRLKRIPNKGG